MYIIYIYIYLFLFTLQTWTWPCWLKDVDHTKMITHAHFRTSLSCGQFSDLPRRSEEVGSVSKAVLRKTPRDSLEHLERTGSNVSDLGCLDRLDASKCVVGAIVKRDAKRLDVYKEFHSVIVHTFKVVLSHFCFTVKVVDWSLKIILAASWSSRWWLGKGPPPARRRSFPIRNVDLKMAWQNYAKEQLQQDSRAPSCSCFDVLGLGHQHG